MNEGTETVEEVTSTEEETPQANTATPLTEERVKEMLAEAETRGEAKATETYKGFQRTVSKTQRENAELKKRLDTPAPTSPNRTQELLLADLKQREPESPLIAQIEQVMAGDKLKADQDARYQIQQTAALGEKAKLEEQIEEAGLDPTHENFDDVWESWDLANQLDGKWERPQKKLTRILKAIVPKQEPEAKTEANTEEEAARKKAEENGTLITDTGRPSAASRSFRQLEDQATADPSNAKLWNRYLEARKEKGIG